MSFETMVIILLGVLAVEGALGLLLFDHSNALLGHILKILRQKP